MEGCVANLLRYILIGTNLIVFIASCIVLGFGIYAVADSASLMELVDMAEIDGTAPKIDSFITAAYLFIVIAVFAMILAFFGCCGAWKESKCMLSTYFAMILVLLVLVIVGAIMGYTVSLNAIKEPLENTMAKYKENPETAEEKTIKTLWDEKQKALRCCGTTLTTTDNSWTVHDSTVYPTSEKFVVPESCCTQFKTPDDRVDECRKTPKNADFNVTGCFEKLEHKLMDHRTDFVIAGVVLCVIMFINMLGSFYMCTNAGKEWGNFRVYKKEAKT